MSGWITRIRRRSIAAAYCGAPFEITDVRHRMEITAKFHAWWINRLGAGESYEFATAFPDSPNDEARTGEVEHE